MNWKKAISFGVLIWILMFVIVSIFIAFDVYIYVWMQAVTAIIAGAISYILAKKIKPGKLTLALGYGLIWVIIGLILDAAITTRFNSEIFSSWPLWLGYALVFLAPAITIKKK